MRKTSIKKDLKGKDILMLLLYLPGVTQKENEPIVGRTRITKTMFLFEKEIINKLDNIEVATLPEFIAYNYGPFSKDLLSDIDFLEQVNLLEKEYTDENVSNFELEENAEIYEPDLGEYFDGIIQVASLKKEKDNLIINQLHSQTVEDDNDDEYGSDKYVKSNFSDSDQSKEVRYFLTPQGIGFVKKEILGKFSESQVNLLMKFKQKINTLDLNAILNYVYNKYPDSAENSLIKEKYLKK